MTERPDFEKIARDLLRDLPFEDGATEAEIEIVVPCLRLVWNARGTADVETIEATIACHRLDWIEQVRRLDR